MADDGMGASTDYGSQAGIGRMRAYGDYPVDNGYYDYYERTDDLEDSDILLGVTVLGIGALSVAVLAGLGIAKVVKALRK